MKALALVILAIAAMHYFYLAVLLPLRQGAPMMILMAVTFKIMATALNKPSTK